MTEPTEPPDDELIEPNWKLNHLVILLSAFMLIGIFFVILVAWLTSCCKKPLRKQLKAPPPGISAFPHQDGGNNVGGLNNLPGGIIGQGMGGGMGGMGGGMSGGMGGGFPQQNSEMDDDFQNAWNEIDNGFDNPGGPSTPPFNALNNYNNNLPMSPSTLFSPPTSPYASYPNSPPPTPSGNYQPGNLSRFPRPGPSGSQSYQQRRNIVLPGTKSNSYMRHEHVKIPKFPGMGADNKPNWMMYK